MDSVVFYFVFVPKFIPCKGCVVVPGWLVCIVPFFSTCFNKMFVVVWELLDIKLDKTCEKTFSVIFYIISRC